MISQASALDALSGYEAKTQPEKRDLTRMLDLVESTDQFYSRNHFPAHLTASAWIVDPSYRFAVMLFHRKLKRWLQPGGHIEPSDLDLLTAARREVQEETGLQQLQLYGDGVFDVDIHSIPARGDEPEHEHFDVRYCFVGKREKLVISAESSDLAWVEVDSLSTLDTDASVRRMASKLSAQRANS